MAFTFDATVGGVSANSYVSVADADDYFTAHLDNSFWAVPTAKKQAALVMATNRLEAERFGGETTASTQALEWPRMYVVDYNGHTPYIPSDTIPTQLKQATYELALYYLKRQAGEFSVDENDLETLSGYKLGPMDFKIKDGIKADRLPTNVQNLLMAIGANAWELPGSKALVMVR